MTTISSCGRDERGKYRDGQAGDQDKGEYRLRNWYYFGQNVVLRHPDPMVRSMLARLARTAALNDHIGYDQNQRTTMYKQLKTKAVGWWPSKIKKDCEADCSSSTAAVVIACGHQLGIEKMQNINPENWTGSLRETLVYLGFEALTASKYTDRSDYLQPGDIVLNESKHVVVNITRGSKATKYVKYKVKSDSAIMRSGHGKKYPITRHRKKGKTVKVDYWHGKWAHTKSDDWVYYKHLERA